MWALLALAVRTVLAPLVVLLPLTPARRPRPAVVAPPPAAPHAARPRRRAASYAVVRRPSSPPDPTLARHRLPPHARRAAVEASYALEETHDHRTTPSCPQHRARRRPGPGPSGWFRAFWRWHFYAAFLVAPVLLILAVTGLIYLFRFQLEPLLHADLMQVSAPSATARSSSPTPTSSPRSRGSFPDAAIALDDRTAIVAGRSTVFSVGHAEDYSTRDVFVNPYGAEVLGSLNPDTTVSGYAVRIHGGARWAGKWR